MVQQVCFLSPHLDDAVLSCGGYIHRLVAEGTKVWTVTVFSGDPNPETLSPLARLYHEKCKLGDNAMEVRRTEDRDAAEVLGMKVQHLGLRECLYRIQPGGGSKYYKEEAIFHANLMQETETLEDVISALVQSRILTDFCSVHIPLGIGGHIDHAIVRKAVETLLAGDDYSDHVNLVYYEDLPYACWDSELGLETVIGKTLYPYLQYIDLASWWGKVNAIVQYKSQTHVLWEDPTQMINCLNAYSRRIDANKYVERYWLKQ